MDDVFFKAFIILKLWLAIGNQRFLYLFDRITLSHYSFLFRDIHVNSRLIYHKIKNTVCHLASRYIQFDVSQAEHNILGVAGVFGGSLFLSF